jgi:putative transposase
MPDHVHVLLAGQSTDACALHFVAAWKQTTGYRHARTCQGRLWQPGYYDRILREGESDACVARYILENPVRGGLAGEVGEFPFAWCVWELMTLYV